MHRWRQRGWVLVLLVASVAFDGHLISRASQQSKRDNALVDAILRRDATAVERLLQLGASADARWDVGPLFYSPERWGTRGMVSFVIDVHACPNEAFHPRMFSDHTVLFLAALRGDAAITKALLRHGANANAMCSNGRTPLTWARRGGDRSVIDLLKRTGAREGRQDPPEPKHDPCWGGYPH